MKEGDVVLSPFPQADGKVKNRPAIVLRVMPPFGDLLVCGVSRQVRHHVEGFDEIIAASDSDFPLFPKSHFVAPSPATFAFAG